MDAPSRLAPFAAGLDIDWIQEVTACATDFLGGYAGQGRHMVRCWLN